MTLMLLGMVPAVNAQPEAPSVGTTVRLIMRGEASPVEGILASTTSTAWTLLFPNGSVSAFALGEVATAKARVTRRNTLRGALIGGGIGLVAGVAFVVGAEDDCNKDPTGFCDALISIVDKAVLFYAPVLGAGGGALIGTLVKTRRWVPVFVPHTSQGASVIGISWRFR
ncbi:MAG: hypothetical protein ABIW94_05560 [Gemmatimonadaceae bacterium]